MGAVEGIDAGVGPATAAAWRVARAGPRVAMLGWLALAVLDIAVEVAARQLGATADAERFRLSWWTYEVADALVTMGASGVALHAMLRGGVPDLRRTGPWACLGLLILMELYWDAVGGLGGAIGDGDPGLGALGLFAAMAGGLAAGAFVFARLLLWPIALLLGDTHIGPAGSWRRMRGWTFGYLGAWLALIIPVIIVLVGVSFGAERLTGRAESIPDIVAEALVSVVLTALATALSAVAYRRRGRSAQSLAEVFA